MTDPVVLRHLDRSSLVAASGARLALTLQQILADRPVAHLVLTGGSMGSAILAGLGASGFEPLVEWHRVHLWWGDERYLPAGDPDRNDTQNGEALLDQLPIPASNVHRVPGPDDSADAADSAARYAEVLAATAEPGLAQPRFDLVLLGVGPDGHIASLFPNHPGQDAVGTTAAITDSPKPPPTRVTLTFGALNEAERVWFLVSGAGKADAVAAALGGANRVSTPAAGVRGRLQTWWLIDADAAGADTADASPTGPSRVVDA